MANMTVNDFQNATAYPSGKGAELLKQVPGLENVVVVPPAPSNVRSFLVDGTRRGSRKTKREQRV